MDDRREMPWQRRDGRYEREAVTEMECRRERQWFRWKIGESVAETEYMRVCGIDGR